MELGQTQSTIFINDFTEGQVLPKIIVFAFPLFLANLLQAVYSVVDMVVVGQVVGETGLSGIAVGGDVLALLTFLSIGFSSAGQVIVSQYIGAERRDKLSGFIGTMSSFMILCSVGMCVICLILREQILTILNTPAEAWEQAMAYSTTCIFGLVFIYGYNLVSAVLRGMGDSKRPLLFVAIASGVNLVLDLLFVAVFHWEAFGAALATVIAQGVSFLTALGYLYKKRDRFGFEFALRHFRMDREELMPLIKLGVPMAIRSAAITFSKLFVNAWINGYGVTVSAVTGVGHKVDMFGNLMGSSIATACNSMVGQNIGAGKYDRITRILGSSLLLNAVCFSAVIAVLALFPQTVFGIFTSEPDVLLVCLEYVPAALVNFVASALRDSMYGFVFGCGNPRLNFGVAILDGIVGRIGFSLLLGVGLGMGYSGFWMGNSIAGVTPFLIGGVYFLSGKWKYKSQLLGS